MTEHLPSLLELQRTDELLDEIAARRTPPGDDRVLGMLATLAEAVDDVPVPAIPEQRTAAAPARVPSGRRTRTPVRQLAGALAIGLSLSSTGIAAAVTGDPLLPIKTVVRHLYDMSHDPTGPDSPWILGGSDKARGAGSDPSTLPPTLVQPHGFDDSPSAKRVHRDATRSAEPMTADERAPAVRDVVAPPTPALEPSGQESSTSTPTDEQPGDDDGQVGGDDSQGEDTAGDGGGNGQGEDPGAERPDPTIGGSDPDGSTPPPPPTCTDPDPNHPENVPINPCPPTEESTDDSADPPSHQPDSTHGQGHGYGYGTGGGQGAAVGGNAAPVDDRGTTPAR